MSEEVKEPTVEETVEKAQEQEKAPKAVLLGTISYTEQEDYEKFLENLDVNQAIFVLVASCNYAQSKGVYSLDESELVARAIKTIKKASSKSTEDPSNNED